MASWIWFSWFQKIGVYGVVRKMSVLSWVTCAPTAHRLETLRIFFDGHIACSGFRRERSEYRFCVFSSILLSMYTRPARFVSNRSALCRQCKSAEVSRVPAELLLASSTRSLLLQPASLLHEGNRGGSTSLAARFFQRDSLGEYMANINWADCPRLPRNRNNKFAQNGKLPTAIHSQTAADPEFC